MKDSKQDLNLNILTNTEPTAEEFSVFKRKVSSLIGGLDLASYKNTQMERRIKTLMLRTNVDNLEDYYNLLKGGSSKYPIDLIKDTGIDPLSQQPFELTMKRMNNVMDEIEKLLK